MTLQERLRNFRHAAFRRDGGTLETMQEAADELDRLEKRVARAEHHNELLRQVDELEAVVERLQAENETLRADAERFTELAKQFSVMGADISGNHAWQWRGNPARLRGPTLAAAIDAMKEKP